MGMGMISKEERIQNLTEKLENLERKRFPSASDEHIMILLEDELYELTKNVSHCGGCGAELDLPYSHCSLDCIEDNLDTSLNADPEDPFPRFTGGDDPQYNVM